MQLIDKSYLKLYVVEKYYKRIYGCDIGTLG